MVTSAVNPLVIEFNGIFEFACIFYHFSLIALSHSSFN
jgi:hypothetical protein